MLDKCFSKNKDIPYRVIEGEAILVDVEEGEVIHLNEVGALIWEAIDGKNKVSDIVNCVCNDFEVNQSEARKDVVSFLKEILEKEVITDE